ncbi:MAG: M3 family oligoendopeptidase [Bacteroidetes bacterium]|nr:M3 family oligoendopeptidase [Bacteroidota bacterium]MCY4204888.1 M3 family oligoendopeptidase [Bacteroidota bacterium]
MNIRETGAEDVHWDLTHLYADESELRNDLSEIMGGSEKFNQSWRGKIASLSATQLKQAIMEYEQLQERAGRAMTYVYLSWATATHHAERGALLQHVRELYTQIGKNLLFFGLEWLKVESAHAQRLMEEEELAGYRHFLECERLLKEYTLSEPEEKVLAEAQVTGRSAWTRYFTEIISRMRFTLRGEELSQEHVLAKLHAHDRDLRREAAESFTHGLVTKEHTLTYIFNTFLADKASIDRMRGFPHWLKSRNLNNEIADETAEALIQSVVERYDLVVRFYELKSKILGVSPLYDYDRYAPVGESDSYYSWSDARRIVLESYGGFHPLLAEIAERFFEEKWIDAPVQEGKQGGAFSHGAVPSVHPYVLLNYTGRARDVQTLAHELGHGVHQFLSRGRGYLQASTPLTTAETASVFGEMLTFQRLLSAESNSRNKLALLIGKIDDTMATVFRQVTMNRFEDAIHTARRTQGELSSDIFAEHWISTQSAMYGSSVTLTDQYRHWWSYIPHFLHTPGYVYAYAFGELLVLALHMRYQQSPDEFPDRYIELMRAGGSDWPHILVARLGVDLQDPEFWQQGLSAIEALIERAEERYAYENPM